MGEHVQHAQSNTPGDHTGQKREIVKVNINAGDFDLDSHISNYTGHTKILRLNFIAEHCPELELEAYRQVINELKKTSNTSSYREICERVGNKLGPEYALDQQWIETMDKQSQQTLERLEFELNGFRTHMIKEKIRLGHIELGDYHYERGDLTTALKCYVRTRDYCALSKHQIDYCLLYIRGSLESGNFSHVSNYVGKAESTPDLKDPVIIAKLKAAAGVALLNTKKYRYAARKFLETTFDLGTNYSEVIAPQDVAIYGSLCALACFERSELKKSVIDNASFRNFLELTPEVRELIHDFYNSRYASCLNYLEKLKPSLLLDIHLHEHVNFLYQSIRSKALVQYFSPFTSIDLNTMAEAFNTTVNDLEKEVSALIIEDTIQARIDSHNKRLYARQTDQRSTTFEHAIKVGNEFQLNSRALLLRVNMMRNDFVVRPPRRDEKEKQEK